MSKNLRDRLDQRMVVDALEHQEANRAIGRRDQQHRVYPRRVIRRQERAAAGGNIFLALQIEPINGVRRDPQQEANQRIGQEPQNVGKRGQREQQRTRRKLPQGQDARKCLKK